MQHDFHRCVPLKAKARIQFVFVRAYCVPICNCTIDALSVQEDAKPALFFDTKSPMFILDGN